MSLQKQLEDIIEDKKYISYDNFKYEVEYGNIKYDNGVRYKITTAERKMRLSKKVKAVKNDKDMITGYEWVISGIEELVKHLWLSKGQIEHLKTLDRTKLEESIRITTDATWVSREEKYVYILGVYKNLSTTSQSTNLI